MQIKVNPEKQLDNCPNCGHGEFKGLDSGWDEHEVEFYFQRLKCPECRISWTEVFTFSRVCDFKDPDGNEIEIEEEDS